ncbi:MAG TPA: DUF1287 domain-containing protein [Blastocatellia bacterium]|nr:DUF1287 domain-containing protein [Blastocatellia bacterium]
MVSRRVPRTSLAFAMVIAVVGLAPPLACSRVGNGAAKAQARKAAAQNLPRHPISDTPQIKQVVDSAIEQIGETFEYDPSYSKLDYPNGDVPLERGVCADVVVRAFRKAGVDLQKEVHEDMSGHFSAYPNKWGATGPDANIDHRRVANLMTFFEHKGKSVPITKAPSDYVPGDVVAWQLDTQVLHIGIVTDARLDGMRNYLIIHNIGGGARIEDVLMSWKIIGHYRMWK